MTCLPRPISLAAAVAILACLQAAPGAEPAPPGPGWTLAFADDFDGEAIDRRKWNVTDPWEVERNRELQAYVPGNIEIADGRLRLRAQRQKAFYDGKVRQFTSAMVTTARKFSQQFGRFEIRARVPKGRGLWPAFWMLPDPPAWPPEIDVLEILGHEPDKIYLTHHWPDPANPGGRSKSVTGEFKGPDFSADFHTFAVEWEATEIRWYVDGELRHRSAESIPRQPMFLLLNLAVGGEWPGAPDESTVFPAWYEIDWVRVWQRSSES